MKSKLDTTGRTVLPIPDRPFTRLVTFDAKDPDSKFTPIELSRRGPQRVRQTCS